MHEPAQVDPVGMGWVVQTDRVKPVEPMGNRSEREVTSFGFIPQPLNFIFSSRITHWLRTSLTCHMTRNT
jgi:hypothetical protein